MKGFKKLALVAAIAAPFSSVHALEALDDSTLSGMTGQAGVTIELDTKVTMDSFTYTDTGSGATGGGSIVMNDVRFGGALVNGDAAGTYAGDLDATDRLDEVKIDIDVAQSGALIIHLGSVDTAGVLLGNNPLDFGLYMGSFTTSGVALVNGAPAAVNTTIASDINIRGVLGPQDIVIQNAGDINAPTKGLISAQGYFEISDSSMNIDIAGVGVTNLSISQDDNPFASGTYTDKDGNAVDKLVDYSAYDLGNGTMASALGNGDDNWAFYAVTIGTETSETGVENALALTVDSFNADIAMDISMGSQAGTALSIGSIAMENLDVSGTKMVIYGH